METTRRPCYARSVKRLLAILACFVASALILLGQSSVSTPPTAATPSIVVASVVQAAKTTLQGTTTIYTVGAATQSFLVTGALYCTTASAAATATLTITYTDPSSTVQTLVPTLATCTTLGSASISTMSNTIRAKNGTAIQYAIAIASTPTFDASVQVVQLSSN